MHGDLGFLEQPCQLSAAAALLARAEPKAGYGNPQPLLGLGACIALIGGAGGYAKGAGLRGKAAKQVNRVVPLTMPTGATCIPGLRAPAARCSLSPTNLLQAAGIRIDAAAVGAVRSVPRRPSHQGARIPMRRHSL